MPDSAGCGLQRRRAPPGGGRRPGEPSGSPRSRGPRGEAARAVGPGTHRGGSRGRNGAGGAGFHTGRCRCRSGAEGRGASAVRAPGRSGDRRRSRIYTGGSRGQRGDGGRTRRGERPTLEPPGAVAGTGCLHREILGRGREGRGGLHPSVWAGPGQRGRKHLSQSGDSPARAVSTRLRRGLGPRRLREGHLSAPPPPPGHRSGGRGWAGRRPRPPVRLQVPRWAGARPQARAGSASFVRFHGGLGGLGRSLVPAAAPSVCVGSAGAQVRGRRGGTKRRPRPGAGR